MTIRTVLVLLVALSCLALAAMFSAGCAKKLEGNTSENEKPIVWFVNVPPEGSRSSVNPIVNWYGQDRDGQIDFYRYLVVREDVIGDFLGKPSDWNPVNQPLSGVEVQLFADSYLGSMADSVWTILPVTAESTDPHTSNIIPMSAQMDDPVRVFVPQFVFVQAFDDEGQGSDIVFRRFLRNDNPPATRIVGFIDNFPFINSEFFSGPATGIRVRWQGSDVVDYPTDAPPFEYEWKLLGPYSEADYQSLTNTYLKRVFITNDARVLRFGEPPDIVGFDTIWNVDSTAIIRIDTLTMGTALIVCDTTYEQGEETESCDTILIDTLTGNNIYGVIDTLLMVFDTAFTNSQYNVVAKTSGVFDSVANEWTTDVWTTDMRDSLYDVYWHHPADTTQVSLFIFAVRSRDDALVPDLTPAWKNFIVINPQHEKDIVVITWNNTADENTAILSKVKTYWGEAINNWINQTGRTGEIEYDSTLDFRRASQYTQNNTMLQLILKYKVAIVVQDAEVSGTWSAQQQAAQNIMVGLQTGVNVWVAARVPLGSHPTGSQLSVEIPSPAYQYFFGVQSYTFPGWSRGFYTTGDGDGLGLPRTEHFIGTLSLDKERWPEVSVDTALLHSCYMWEGTNILTSDTVRFPYRPFMPELGALPQVGWCVRTFDTEAMYLFKSMYGNEHAMFSELSFHGRPVGIRLNRGLFRTVHMLFTPLAMERNSGQKMVNGVLDWLYEGRVQAASADRGSRNAAVASDLADRYWQCYWEADGDYERFLELFRNAY
jgi:hypothetical protein